MSLNPNYRNYVAGANVTGLRIAKYDSTAGQVVPASSPTDAFAGTFAELSPLAGQRVDVAKTGIAPVEAGAAFAVGAALTADSQARAVAATRSALVETVIGGGPAGNHTVTGITTGCTLVSVIQANIVADTGTSATGNKIDSIADLTSEFTISAANTINNATGTDTTSDSLIVTYRTPIPRLIGFAEEAANAAGDIVNYLAAPCYLA